MGTIAAQELVSPVPGGISYPDYRIDQLQPEEFRNLILARGAVMLRNAADPELLEKIQQRLTNMFASYAMCRSRNFSGISQVKIRWNVIYGS